MLGNQSQLSPNRYCSLTTLTELYQIYFHLYLQSLATPPWSGRCLEDYPTAARMLQISAVCSQISSKTRLCFQNITEGTNHVSGQMIYSKSINADYTLVHVLCMQLLDASLKLLPISELIESLQSLLARTEDSVSKYSLYQRRFRLPAPDPPTSTSIIQISSQRQQNRPASIAGRVSRVPPPSHIHY